MPDQPHLRIEMSANRQALVGLRDELEAFARTAGAAEVALGSIKLAVTEAVTNALVHAFSSRQRPGTICVEARALDGDSLVVTVMDDGDGMAPRPDSPGLGLGLPLIAELADDFRVEANGGAGTRVSMRFSLDGSGTAFAD